MSGSDLDPEAIKGFAYMRRVHQAQWAARIHVMLGALALTAVTALAGFHEPFHDVLIHVVDPAEINPEADPRSIALMEGIYLAGVLAAINLVYFLLLRPVEWWLFGQYAPRKEAYLGDQSEGENDV